MGAVDNTPGVNKASKSAKFGLWRVFVPVIIGLCVVVWLFKREFNADIWHMIHFDTRVVLCIVLAWISVSYTHLTLPTIYSV